MKRLTSLKRILSYMRLYRATLIISVVCACASVVASLFVPILTGRAIDAMTGKGGVDFNTLSACLGVIGILILIVSVSQWIMGVSNNFTVFSSIRDLRNEAAAKLHKVPVSFIDKTPHGDILSRIITDTDQLSDGLLLGLSQGITGVITLALTICFMFSVHAIMAVIVLCASPLALLLSSFISRRSYRMFVKRNEIRGETSGYLEEAINGEDIIRLYGMQANAESGLEKRNSVLRDYDRKAVFYSSLPNPATRFVYALIYAGLTCGGAFFVLKGSLSIGQMVSFLSYATQFTKPFNEITDMSAQFQNALSCAGRVFELIDAEEEETEHCPSQRLQFGSDPLISFDNVTFAYKKGYPVIQDFTLEINKGEHIALVGPTGCGKTTIINLLMRFFDIDTGCIRLGSEDIREMDRGELRSHFGMVLQDTWLKEGSIRENIALGKPESTSQEIREAAEKAHAHGFISRLKDGYDTFTDNEAAGLSQGQKQLICIARVMLADPEILILDEATSSIDTMTETKVQQAFDRLMVGRTSIVVAHRLSTIQNADRIVVMKAGRIIETGTHSELMNKGGFYSQLRSAM